MNRSILRFSQLAALVLVAVITAAPSFAVDVTLNAAPIPNYAINGAGTVPMWGYGLGQNGAPTIPGPVIEVPVGDTTLNITLWNNLTVPTSIIVQGLTFTPGAQGVVTVDGKARKRSLVAEVAPGASRVYSFTGVRPGTYVYHSGSHPQVQAPMGLYGAVKRLAAAGEIQPGVAITNDIVLVYSEIDPALNTAVANGTYGNAALGGPTSTFDHRPKFFLINGQPFTAAQAPIAIGNEDQPVAVRLVNAGVQTRVPTLLGGDMTLLGEDGYAYPAPKSQYSVLLPPLKAVDAVVRFANAGKYALYDAKMGLTNNGQFGGGMLRHLEVAALNALIAVDDVGTVAEDTPLVVAAPGVLANDNPATGVTAVLVTNASGGTVSLLPTGGYTYTPGLNFNGSDSFTYRTLQSGVQSAPAVVRITVTPVNDAPLAVADTGTTVQNTAVTIPVVANDTDVDGNSLTVQSVTTPASGTAVVSADGKSVIYTANATTGQVVFSYTVTDNQVPALTSTTTVTVTVNPRVNMPPVAVNDSRNTKMNTAVSINVVQNDSDPDGTINPATVVILYPTLPPPQVGHSTKFGGRVVNNGNGTVTFIPKLNFRGTDEFTYNVKDNEGATSNTATVRVNVTR